jgi:hypothetical protein
MLNNLNNKKMKRVNVIHVIMILALAGLILPMSFCTKTNTVTNTVTKTVTDTIKGNAISGAVTYPNSTGSPVAAVGAILKLYFGSDTTGTLVATTFSDASGNYKFGYLLAGTYYITSTFNTSNGNGRLMKSSRGEKNNLNGITFATDPGFKVTMAAAPVTQNVALTTFAATSIAKFTIVAADTLADSSFHYMAVEIHTDINFQAEEADSIQPGMTLTGSFPNIGDASGGFKIVKFKFDQANPQNTYFTAYVLTHTQMTNNIGRDTARGGCLDGFWDHDTIKNPTTGAATVLLQTDTAYYTVTSGQVVKYGAGYLAHGTLAPCYKHQGGEIVSPKVNACAPDTVLGYTGQYGWDTRIALPVDFYFEYQGAKQKYSGANYNWFAEFAGTMTFDPLTFFMKGSVGGSATLTVNLQMKGATNYPYWFLQ